MCKKHGGTKTTMAFWFVAIAVLLSLGIASVCAVGSEEGVTFDEITLESAYTAGDELQLPSVTAKKGTEQKQATAVLSFPSGRAMRKQTVTLTETGIYTLVYRAEFDGELYKSEKTTFTVRHTLYSAQSAVYNEDTECLDVTLTNTNPVFRLNKVVDVSASDGTEPLFLGYVHTTQDPDRPVTKMDCLKIRLTDAYDPSVFVEFTQNYPNNDIGASYAKAAGNGQLLSGPENGTWEGDTGTIHRGGIYGVACGSDPRNTFVYNTSFAWDNNRKQALVYRDSYRGNLIADLDDPRCFYNAWQGFTTGEVFIEIEGSGFTDSSVVSIETLYGVQDLSKNEVFDDDKKPQITVDYDGYDPAALPEGVVGFPYRVFDAAASDAYAGVLPVSRRVYHGYGSDAQNEYDVTDGRFVPKVPGVYTVEYTAVDWFGLRQVATVRVNVTESKPTMKIVFASDETQTALVGKKKEITAFTVENAVGKCTAVTQVLCGGTATEITEEAGKSYFLPTQAADYTVRITVTDYLQRTVTGEYTVTANFADAPIFTQIPQLPPYFFKGYAISLPEAKAYDYKNQADVPVEIFVKEGNGDFRKLSGTSYTPATAHEANVTVQYRAGTAQPLTYEAVGLDAGTNGTLDIAKFFVGSGATAVAQDDNVKIALTQDGDGSALFANKLPVSGLAFSLKTIASSNAFEKVNVYLYDSVAADKYVRISFGNFSGVYGITVTGNDTVYAVNADWNGNGRLVIRYGETAGGGTLRTDNDSIVLTKYADGTPFDGFASYYAYMRIEIENGHGDAAVLLESINGNVLSNEQFDFIAPSVWIAGDYGGYVEKDTEYVLYPMFAGDVLSPHTSLSFSFLRPDGAPATDVNGLRLENITVSQTYRVKMDTFGEWRMTYSATDGNNNTFYSGYVVSVPDNEPPTVEIEGNIPATVKAGTVLTLPKITVHDNLDGEYSFGVSVVAPDGIVSWPAYNAQTGTYGSVALCKKGTYRIRILALDAAFNSTVREFTVTVTE